MRTFIRFLAILLPVGWIGYLAFDGDAARSVHWMNTPSAENWLAVGLLALAGLAWGLTARHSSQRPGVVAIAVGVATVAIGYFGGHAASVIRGHIINPIGFGGGPALKPNSAETIVGYHYLTPHQGGAAAFADGSVQHLSADQFRDARKAEPPVFEPAWRSPVKPRREGPPAELAKETDAQRIVRQARERAVISSDLKQMVTAQFLAGPKPLLDPDALAAAAKLDARQRAALDDGTYVWFFGWTARDLDAVERHQAAFRHSNLLGWMGWGGFLLCGAGVGLILFGFTAMSRGPSNAADSAVSVSDAKITRDSHLHEPTRNLKGCSNANDRSVEGCEANVREHDEDQKA